jgi:hypothetical protein
MLAISWRWYSFQSSIILVTSTQYMSNEKLCAGAAEGDAWRGTIWASIGPRILPARTPFGTRPLAPESEGQLPASREDACLHMRVHK